MSFSVGGDITSLNLVNHHNAEGTKYIFVKFGKYPNGWPELLRIGYVVT